MSQAPEAMARQLAGVDGGEPGPPLPTGDGVAVMRTQLAVSTSPDASIRFDPEGIETVIRRIDDILTTEIRPLLRQVEVLARIEPRGEIASDEFGKVSNERSRGYIQELRQHAVQLQEYADRLRESKRNYALRESRTAEDMDRRIR